MSVTEFKALVRGDVLTNRTVQGEKWMSTARGFCFIPEHYTHHEKDCEFTTVLSVEPESALDDFWHLKRVIDENGVLVRLEIPDDQLKHAYGAYSGFLNTNYYGEVCTKHYGIRLGTRILGYRFYILEEEFPCGCDDEYFQWRRKPAPLTEISGTKDLVKARQEVAKFAADPYTFALDWDDMWEVDKSSSEW